MASSGATPHTPPKRLPDDERAAWLTLAWGVKLGPAGFHRMLELCGSAVAALNAPPEVLDSSHLRLKDHEKRLLLRLRERTEVFVAEAQRLERTGIRVVLSPEAAYPIPLRRLPHPPPVICIAGQLLSVDTMAVGVVGTRTPSKQGGQMARTIGETLAGEGFTVVSGLAKGIDAEAHMGALLGGGRTLAILGNGISMIYPEQNRRLAASIRERGAVLSELPPGSQPSVPFLMARNRLISIMSQAVIVVESRETGGSLTTAEYAEKYGTPTYAVQWEKQRPENAGNAILLEQGALSLKSVTELPALCQTLRAKPQTANDPTDPNSQLPLF